MDLLERVAQWVSSQSLTAISVTHHLNIAARFADRMVLLRAGSVIGQGPPSDVMTEDLLRAAFQWPVTVMDLPGVGRQAIPLRRKPSETPR
jgi:iron complex transport system ATP-binding protein